MTSNIQTATLGDCEDVVALWKHSDLTRPWNDAAEDFRLAVEGKTSDILVLKIASDIAATIMVGFDGHRGWVYYLGVHPEHRREGLGRQMMLAAEQWLVEWGAPKIQLMVREDNEQALGFYKALGYKVQPVVTMGRRLD